MYTTGDIHKVIHPYRASALALLLEKVEVPIVIDGTVVMISQVERTSTEDDSWDSSVTTSIVFKAESQFFRLEVRNDSWGDGDDTINPWDITEVQPITRTVTAYRQVPYEKEVTEYL